MMYNNGERPQDCRSCSKLDFDCDGVDSPEPPRPSSFLPPPSVFYTSPSSIYGVGKTGKEKLRLVSACLFCCYRQVHDVTGL
jgi:hypothetical protein